MVKRICLFVGMFMLLTNCDTKLVPLSLDKVPYTGDELRIDGYYYSDVTEHNQYTGEWTIKVAVLYENGFCYHSGLNTKIDHPDNLRRIENEILLDKERISKALQGPYDIGVFKINSSDITIENWAYSAVTFSHYGEIIDDETFVINKRVNNKTGKITFSGKLAYHFQEFSPLPDSSNKYTRAIFE